MSKVHSHVRSSRNRFVGHLLLGWKSAHARSADFVPAPPGRGSRGDGRDGGRAAGRHLESWNRVGPRGSLVRVAADLPRRGRLRKGHAPPSGKRLNPTQAASLTETLSRLPRRRSAVDRSCLGGVIGIQHSPYLTFGDIEIAGELTPRDPGLPPSVVQGRLQGDLRWRDHHGPLLVGRRRFRQIAAFAYRRGDQLPQQIPGFSQGFLSRRTACGAPSEIGKRHVGCRRDSCNRLASALLEALPVDPKIGEHLLGQALADLRLPVFAGGPAAPGVERSMGAGPLGRDEADCQVPIPRPPANAPDELRPFSTQPYSTDICVRNLAS